jgi:FkbM family methyltransferase
VARARNGRTDDRKQREVPFQDLASAGHTCEIGVRQKGVSVGGSGSQATARRSGRWRVPGFLRSHRRLREVGREVKRIRRRAFERLGSDRYSHPAYDDLDRKLAHYLPDTGGVFVEAGAYDGYWGSNTYWLERFRGWTGVLVEPLPEAAALAKKERPRSQVFQCALVAAGGDQTWMRLQYGGLMSVVADAWNPGHEREHAQAGAARGQHRETFELVVPARTLSSVLSEAGVTDIDLMTLDVEGFETSVLRGLDLFKHRPRFLLVEMLQEERERRKIEALLGDGYGHEAQLSRRDHLYRRMDGVRVSHDRSLIARDLSTPVSRARRS